MPVHVPPKLGSDAMDSLEAVAWDCLDHAYGTGVGDELYEDVRASLALLADGDFDRGLHALYSNICHQGTIYEATAHAVPFLVCFAAGPDNEDQHVEAVLCLLAEIRLSAGHRTSDGSAWGAFGVDVGTNTVEAFSACKQELGRIDRDHVFYGDMVDALAAAVDAVPADQAAMRTLALRLNARLDARLE